MLSKEYSIGQLIVLVIRRWPVTLLIPVFAAAVVLFGTNHVNKKIKLYTASTQLVFANKPSNGKSQAGEIQDKVLAQSLTDELLTTYTQLFSNRAVVKQVIKQVEGKDTYTDLQLNRNQIPNLQKNISVNTKAKSMLVDVKVTADTPIHAKKIANELVKTVKKVEKETWGTSSLKVLEPATEPGEPNKKNAVKLSGVTFISLVVLLSATVIIKDSLREK